MKLIFYIVARFLLSIFPLQSQVENQIPKKPLTIEIANTPLFAASSSKEKTELKPAKLNPTFFILGTLSDYMGRFTYVSEKDQIDKYYPYEKPMVDFLTPYINSELSIKVDTVFKKSSHSKMFSQQLSVILNSFYDENDKIKEDKFADKQQINSFLAGVYYRYGDKLDSSIYKIQLANSPKHQNCYNFLKQAGCYKIFYKFLKNIPAQFILYFEPSPELKEYLELVETQRSLLKRSYSESMNEILENFDQQVIEFNNKELESIQSAFK